ncbi:NADH dehydrogenase [ubiquinone] iron-sulfur protein 4, mitochondrial-like [Oppia nitens]|uniref:NADH dehydrogenase [ubiquinone] iron-sulfur protein 4, mitochondrial-like n=1 Tax=Oppia nitens TaxID=1686743 RepID=UPI0023DB5E75|nr:NADH dehydrogenase [ubiquinone] iron-sulfur protein 4, mitochondrial-like [Oppia nitens]
MSHLLKTSSPLRQIYRLSLATNSRSLTTKTTPDGLSKDVLAEKKDPSVELMDAFVKQHKEIRSKTTFLAENELTIADFNGVPKEHIYERRVRISKPSKNAMQSGAYGRDKWRIEFESRERWENPLMGWTSTGDPLSNMNLCFATKEEAADFCRKNGWYYEIIEPQERRNFQKSYAENFSWNKRTRVGSK